MALTKMVDGVRVQVGAAEEQAIRNEWDTDDPITSSDVNAERDRRIARGISVTTSVAGTFPVQARQQDRNNITALCLEASLRIGNSDTTPFAFRDANNTDHNLTPAEMVEVGEKVFVHVKSHYRAAMALKDTDPIPQDYATNETYWP